MWHFKLIIDASYFELKDTHFTDQEKADLVPNRQNAESLDLPINIATLCDTFADASRQTQQENQRFEEILLQVLTPDRSIKRLPVKQSSAPFLSNEDHLDLLERRVQQTRCENQHFETFLKRNLDDAC